MVQYYINLKGYVSSTISATINIIHAQTEARNIWQYKKYMMKKLINLAATFLVYRA